MHKSRPAPRQQAPPRCCYRRVWCCVASFATAQCSLCGYRQRIGLLCDAAQHYEVRVFLNSFYAIHHIVTLFVCSLDAIDSRLPHTADNVQWVCLRVNLGKSEICCCAALATAFHPPLRQTHLR